ncbi:outer envelope pore protein 24, chloroplastic isoform X2 [Cryptomeria japonica]|uniref:outer envelope pore protein 24, chloroplastic isoform X2 n=1 Tax=Cryptomeria japonica TaxID=3369 RepID=UPI0025ACBC27|nr:outer envelope pore protein 24, chloroplastic isoform X2 [Cryptomeria japonica]
MENTPPEKPIRKVTKGSIKSKYDVYSRAASATFSVNVGDLKLKTTCTDATFVKGPCLNGIVLGVEKPGFFMMDYDLPQKAANFQFMSSAKISGKQLKLTYIHAQKANRTMLDGSLVFDPSNKLSANYSFMAGSGQLKYSYIHQGDRTFEPAYDFKTNSWNFSMSQKVYGADTLKTSYDTFNKRLGLEWTRESKDAGSFKELQIHNHIVP